MLNTLSEESTVELFLSYMCNADSPIEIRADKVRKCIKKLMKTDKSFLLNKLSQLNTNTMLLKVMEDSIATHYKEK